MSLARALSLAATTVILAGCRREVEAPPQARQIKPSTRLAEPDVRDPRSVAAAIQASYVGSERCGACHAEQAEHWTGSDHDLAMQVASPETVLGAFDGQEFAGAGETLRFVRSGEDHTVEVTPTGGETSTWVVRHVFGVDPLQQLLIEPGKGAEGQLQALTVAWDTRPAEQGGQRWFALQPDAPPGDRLHWTEVGFNWNRQCADCHSTALERGCDPDSGRCETRYAAIDVGCEACHGPGSAHLAWAETRAETREGERGGPAKGLVHPLTKPDARRWVLEDGAAIARLSTQPDRSELDSCAPCHARRSELGPGRGETFDDEYRLALLDDPLYFADGQIRDEVFVLGSFLQSKMYAAGVVCSDCHEPHSLELRTATVTETCESCHRPEVFAAPSHHMHAVGSEAAQCESCHMPERVYMGVDGRRDHRFGVPAPAVSARVGSPDPCLACHGDRDPNDDAGHDAAWAEAAIEANFTARRDRWDFASVLWQARGEQAGARQALEDIVLRSKGPAIIRATALAELAAYPSPALVETVTEAVGSDDVLVRRTAAVTARSLAMPERAAAIRPLLGDLARSVRIEAAGSLMGADTRDWSAPDRQALALAIEEYRQAKLRDAAYPEALVDLAELELIEGQPERARAYLRRAIGAEPSFTAAYLNLADLERALGDDARAEAVLREALDHAAEPALVRHALGLTLVRLRRSQEALVELKRAAELEPDVPRMTYVYAVALFDAGRRHEALALLDDLHQRRPGNTEVLLALVSFAGQLGDHDAAKRYAEGLDQR